MRSTLIIIILCVFCACTKRTADHAAHTVSYLEDTAYYDLKLVRQISSFDDSVYLTKIKDVAYDSLNFYLCDYETDQIFILNTDFSLRKVFGESGEGPSDLRNPASLDVNSRYLFVMNSGDSSIKIFDKYTGRFVASVKQPYFVDYQGDIAVDNNNHIYQQSNREKLISVYDRNSEIIRSYGKFSLDFLLETKDRINDQTNNWNTVIYGNNLFCMNIGEPLLLVYDLNSIELNGSYDLSKVKEFKSWKSYVDEFFERDQSGKSSFVSFPSFFVSGNDIYILYSTMNPENQKAYARDILHFKLEDQQLSVYRNLRISQHGWYETFVIKDGQLITFNNYSSALEIYELPE